MFYFISVLIERSLKKDEKMNGTLIVLLIIGHFVTGILTAGYFRANIVNAITTARKNKNESLYEFWYKKIYSSKKMSSVNWVSILFILLGYASFIAATIVRFSLPKEERWDWKKPVFSITKALWKKS